MAKAVRKAFAADADSYDRPRRKLVPCFDDFYRTALELIPFKPDERSKFSTSAQAPESFPR